MKKEIHELSSSAGKGEKLIQCVKDNEIFPIDAVFDNAISNNTKSSDADYICIIDWKLNTDHHRPNKRSRPIKLIISNAALSDCNNIDKAKNNLLLLLKKKIQLFNPEHNETYPASEEWVINTLELNNYK